MLPKSTDDVRAVVSCADAANLSYIVRNGGHNYEAMSAGNGGIVIDMSGLTELSITYEGTASAEVTVGAGWLLGPLYLELTRRGLVLPGGTCPGVGVSGVTLGGGLGYATRALGMTSDKVSSALVVTADGNIVTASSSKNQGLLFALRGGGGNYGIVTSWNFTLPFAPKGPVTWFKYSWPYTNASEAAGHNAAVMAAWNAWQPWKLPKNFSLVELLIGRHGITSARHMHKCCNPLFSEPCKDTVSCSFLCT
jgi:FAD/FMN-containing dehydrogenase